VGVPNLARPDPYYQEKRACKEFLSYISETLPEGHQMVDNSALIKALAIIWSNSHER
jgi:hypothetical protein